MGALEESWDGLSKFFFGGERLDETLQRLVVLAANSVPNANLCGITMMIDDTPTTPVFSDAAVVDLDRGQYEAGDGPCLTAFRESTVVSLDSVDHDQRWPHFNRVAAGLGVSAVLSTPMQAAGRRVGALNVYSRRAGALDDESRRVAEQFASHAAIMLANTRAYWDALELSQNLQQALHHRDVIGQAKGILMAQSGLDADEAFALLVRASQRENRKLYEIALELAARAASPARRP